MLVKCKECGEEVSTEAKACPKCGAPVEITLGDKMIAASASPPKKKPGCLTQILLGIVGIFVLIIIGAIFTDTPETNKENTTKQPSQKLGIQAKKIKPNVKESCLSLSSLFGAGSQYSDLQKEELWKKYEGKIFEWPLEIVEVSSGLLGGYRVQCKCLDSKSFIQDIQLSYDDNAKPYVLSLQVKKIYQLKGKLESQSTLLGIGAKGIPE